ncbi:MAG: dethiobiotin synthase [Deltaproteobacteria bacterium]|nr:dethiobiotin synthase [Deltaproteobacteria bacterium]
MNGLYVVGTSWGVGTTTTSVGMIGALRGQGLRVSAFKPVEVGCSIAKGGGAVDGIPGGELSIEARRAYERLNELVGPPSMSVSTRTATEALHPADTERLAAALGEQRSLDELNSFRYSPLVAPAMAAKLAERPMSLEGLRASAERASRAGEVLVVDGSGGVMEPFAKGVLQRDLIAALGFPVLLVSTTARESINTVLLSLEVLRGAGLKVAGVVLHRREKRVRVEEAAVPLMIEMVEGDVVRGVFPYFTSEQLGNLESLGARFSTHIDVDALVRLVCP